MDPFAQVQPYEQIASQSENSYLNAQSELTKLPDMLNKAVYERFASSPLFKQREEAASGLMTAGPNVRSELSTLVNTPQSQGGVILSPTQQMAIEAARNAAYTVPLQSANALLKAAFGGLEGLVGAGTNAYKAQVEQLQGKAQLDRQRSDSMLKNLIAQEELKLKQRELALKSGGGGLTAAQQIALFNALKPSATQESSAIQAQSGLSAVKQISDLLSGGNANNILWWGDPAAKNNILARGGVLGRAIGGENANLFRNAAREAYDVLTRTRTGAALNLNEEQFYKQFIPQLGESEAVWKDKLDRLANIYQQEISLGTNPTGILQGLMGNTNSDGFIPD